MTIENHQEIRSSDLRVESLHEEMSGFRRFLIFTLVGVILTLLASLATGFAVYTDHNQRITTLETEARMVKTAAKDIEKRSTAKDLELRDVISEVSAQQKVNTELLIRLTERMAINNHRRENP